jgi:hypothetical protein
VEAVNAAVPRVFVPAGSTNTEVLAELPWSVTVPVLTVKAVVNVAFETAAAVPPAARNVLGAVVQAIVVPLLVQRSELVSVPGERVANPPRAVLQFNSVPEEAYEHTSPLE